MQPWTCMHSATEYFFKHNQMSHRPIFMFIHITNKYLQNQLINDGAVGLWGENWDFLWIALVFLNNPESLTRWSCPAFMIDQF